MEISNFQKTKILATVGPASNSYSNLLNLIKAGVDAFRLNFSHGKHEEQLKVFESIQSEFPEPIGHHTDFQMPSKCKQPLFCYVLHISFEFHQHE